MVVVACSMAHKVMNYLFELECKAALLSIVCVSFGNYAFTSLQPHTDRVLQYKGHSATCTTNTVVQGNTGFAPRGQGADMV